MLALVVLQACVFERAAAASALSRADALSLDVSGGIYPDRALAEYVRSVGMSLVQAAGQPRKGWEFLVLDTPEANAFSLPHGRIYVTRGMLALANDEAELATVLAHEIGHAVSGDSDRAEPDPGRRRSEFRADRLGMSYLERAGYDARAQVDFLYTLLASHRLAIQLAGGDPAMAAIGDAGHPALADRLRVAERAAVGASRGHRYRERYLSAIAGMVWGDGSPQGYASGGIFVQPELGFALNPPPGYVLDNRSDALMANGPRGAIFLLDRVPDPGGSPADYLLLGWLPDIGEGIRAGAVIGLRASVVNGLDTARARVALFDDGSERVADLTVVRLGGYLYRLTGLHRADDMIGEAALDAASSSFRVLGAAEARRARPLVLRIHRIVQGDDVRAMADAMPVEAPRQTFDLLNGLSAGKVLRIGDQIKIISE